MASQFVGPRNDPDGLTENEADRTTRDGGKVTTDLHGKYLEQSRYTRVFTGVSASTGIAPILPATTGGHPTLWNPSDSGRLVSIIRLELSWVSGANQPSAIEWAATLNAGSSIGTAAPIVTYTIVAPVGIVGGAIDNKAKWSPTTNTFTAAPVYLRPTGFSMFTGIGATAVAPFALRADYDGDFVIGPGTAISLCTQANVTTAVFQVSLTWEEVNL